MTRPRALWFCVGTAGELIKVYPLLRRATERGLSWRLLATGQSAVNFWTQWDQFRLPRERTATLLSTSRDLHTSAEALRWFARANLLTRSALRRTIRAQMGGEEPTPDDIWIVHGDTLSTLVGARFARRLGVPLAHVEAGLRSPMLLKPFPEEINRRLVSRLACYHFPQDETATENLLRARVRGKIVCSGGNTLFDAIQYVVRDFAPPEVPTEPYVVANVHRFENLASRARWEIIVEVLARAARRQPVLLVLHPPTRQKLEDEPQARRRLEDAGVRLLPRQSFTTFIPLLSRAEYVISDGGSNQEECYYLGMPCLILRDATERVEGLADGPCVLSRFDARAIDAFLSDPGRYRRAPVRLPRRPSDIILEAVAP